MFPNVLPSPCCQACPLERCSQLAKKFRTCTAGRSHHPARGRPWSWEILASDLHRTLASWCRASSAALLLPQARPCFRPSQVLAHLGDLTPGSSSEWNSCSFLLITVLVSPQAVPPFPAAGSPHSSCPTPSPMGHFTVDSVAILSPL